MSAPSNKAKRICAMFDSYCKTVLRNASRNLKRAQANREKKEFVGEEPMHYLLDLIYHEDSYPSEQLVLYADKFSCVVYDETLYFALLSLPEQQRAVLLLDFWHDWTDEKIADYLEVTPRTVYNLRQRAFHSIRRTYEQEEKTETGVDP